jgi:hypothetical protein
MTRKARSLGLFAVCGAAVALTGPSARAQTLINISGATLFESFFVAPASTNDYIDVDGDGIARIFNTNDQLDPGGLPPPGQSLGQNAPWWTVHYRETGSVFGLQELINNGTTFATDGDTGVIPAITSSKSFLDGNLQFITNGVASNPAYNANNPGGCPVRSNLVTLQSVQPGSPSDGIRIDLAPLDIPTIWAVQNTGPGIAAYSRTPGTGGYGTNPRRSVNKQGTTTGANFANTLANLGPRNLNTTTPDANTIFDTPVSGVPIAVMVNQGVGMTQIKQSEIRHLFATGRTINGENLTTVTRDSGSGTRNGFANSIGLDPSWCVGENVGGVDGVGGSVLATQHILGPDFVPSNKIGSGDMESTMFNVRLGVGFSGAERAASGPGWGTTGKCEVLAVQADLSGGTTYVRPGMAALLHNTPATGGYVISGTEQFASLGDPLAAPVNKGGNANGNPQIPNVEAAAYVNNITRSIAAFDSLPGGSQTLFTPGEFLATKFVLVASTDSVHSLSTPLSWIANPAYNASLQTWISTNNTVFNNGFYSSYGTASLNGKVPTRKTGVAYSDGVANGNNYVDQLGNTISYASSLTSRNRIAGDFNGDGLRDLNDATEMLKAYWSRHGGPTWVPPAGTGAIAGAPGSDAVIEILGDFNGDGNFDAADIRYWADGLAMDPATGKLNRKMGFKAIDDAWQALTGNNNFFGTVIAGGRPYHNGDSVYDVAGSGGAARGWAPVGSDGVVDAQDVAYIQAQFMSNAAVTDGHANWDNLNEAVSFDLSCDVTGDLIVDQADVDAINAVLGVCYANCDGSTTAPVLNVLDFACFLNRFAAGDSYANCDHSTTPPTLNVLDFACFLNQFAVGCP